MKKLIATIVITAMIGTSFKIAKADGLLLNQQSTTTTQQISKKQRDQVLFQQTLLLDAMLKKQNTPIDIPEKFLTGIGTEKINVNSIEKQAQINELGQLLTQRYGSFATVTQNLSLQNAQITTQQSWTSFIYRLVEISNDNPDAFGKIIYLLNTTSCSNYANKIYTNYTFPTFVISFYYYTEREGNNPIAMTLRLIRFLNFTLQHEPPLPPQQTQQFCKYNKAVIAKTIVAILNENINEIDKLYQQQVDEIGFDPISFFSTPTN